MSDINIDLDGLIAFIAAAGLGLLLVLGILVTSAIALIGARRRHEPFSHQRLFQQIIGMLASLFGCIVVVVLLLLTDRMAPRGLAIWLDHWLWAWFIIVVALWPASAFAWKSRLGRVSAQ